MTKSKKPEDDLEPGDELDDLVEDDDSPAAVRDQLRRALRTKGAKVAIETMLQVAQDPKAQASARATCAVGLLRAAGYLGKKAEEEDETDTKSFADMSMAELEREWKRARAKSKKLSAIVDDEDDGGA